MKDEKEIAAMCGSKRYWVDLDVKISVSSAVVGDLNCSETWRTSNFADNENEDHAVCDDHQKKKRPKEN